MAGKDLEELLVSSEVQTARDRLEDYDAAELAADTSRMVSKSSKICVKRSWHCQGRSECCSKPSTGPGRVQESRSTTPATAQVYRVVRAASSTRAARRWHASDSRVGRAGTRDRGVDMTILTARAGTLTEGVVALRLPSPDAGDITTIDGYIEDHQLDGGCAQRCALVTAQQLMR